MNFLPFFSIVIPTYNRAGLIVKTISSVLSQKFQEYELIIIDDGSTDNTEEAVLKFRDPRIQYIKKTNGERGAARNFGRTISKGKYLNFFDSDDLMYPNHLQVAKDFVDNFNSPEFFHLAYDLKRDDGSTIAVMNNFNEASKTTILFNNILSCNGIFLKRDIAERFPFEEDRRLASSEDWQLWIRLMSRFTLQFCNEVTSTISNHDSRSIRTSATVSVISRDLFLIEKLKEDDAVCNLYGKRFNKFMADRFTFFMLNLAMEGNRRSAIQWAKKALKTYPLILRDKRFLASAKKIIFR